MIYEVVLWKQTAWNQQSDVTDFVDSPWEVLPSRRSGSGVKRWEGEGVEEGEAEGSGIDM